MMIKRRPAIEVLAACVTVLASGCASMSGLDGTAEYACKAPQGVQCDSVSGNYYNAIQNNLPSQRQGRASDGETEKARGTRQPELAPERRPAGFLPTALPAADKSSGRALAMALRSQARVLRLWFKPWEDADHDLYDQGYVYVQIDNGRWLIDHAQQRIRDAYAPIRAPRAPAASAQGAVTAAKPADSAFVSRPVENGPWPAKAPAGARDVPTIDTP